MNVYPGNNVISDGCAKLTNAKCYMVEKSHVIPLFSTPTVDPFDPLNAATTMVVNLVADNKVVELLELTNLTITTADANEAPITQAVGTVSSPIAGLFSPASDAIALTPENTAGQWTVQFTAKVKLFGTLGTECVKTFTHIIDAPYTFAP